ncbi:hypothetical protein HMF8227_00195 [Saliniradius amylolyticus]|uniref:Uncharacterized protein n=1 Tax=Saliniradius amylolyticus TaxID=2183582 RepID=A0A2S2DZC2_9ALTE|nr:hypothetical protein [Saliniradius amylolyticus]AWL10703.1 hypothetical protein HMF8227_00195 [Saliniradius amylolyticus]
MKVIKLVALLCLVVIAAGLFWQRHAIACEAVSLSGYQMIAPGVFASPELNNPDSLLTPVRKGKERVEATFGVLTARPTLILVANAEQAADFGANSTATAHFTPFGTCMVLGPKGQNVDVIAHEWVHAEVGQRVGWFRFRQEIPVWFNEGVALMVDHRSPFLVKNIHLSQAEVDAVKQLNTGGAFFDGANTHKHYLASRLAVESLEPASLYSKLARIRDGENFDRVFQW